MKKKLVNNRPRFQLAKIKAIIVYFTAFIIFFIKICTVLNKFASENCQKPWKSFLTMFSVL